MSDAGRMLVTMMMLGSMISISGNEYSGQPVDFDLMDDPEKPDTDSNQRETEGAEE